MRCTATRKRGGLCKNHATNGSVFCSVHRDRVDIASVASTTLGAVLGNAVAPGIGGLIGGALVGNATNMYWRKIRMVKKKVFVSFDYDNDRTLKEFIIGQSKLADSPFEVIDHSLKEAAPEASWETKANAAIKRSDVVIVMVGPRTHRAPGVLKEVAMARNANRYIVQIIGYRDGNYTAVPGAGRLYQWNWENLKKILS